MSEKRFDPNTVIGFILIAVILLWFSLTNQPIEQPPSPTPATTEVTQKVATDSPSNPTILKDSNLIKEELVTLENEVLRVVFSTKNAQMQQVELKNFKTYQQTDLLLMDKETNQFDWQFDGDTGGSFIYTLAKISETTIRMSRELKDGTLFQITYELSKGKTYFLNSYLTTSTNKRTQLKWDMDLLRQEKSPLNEDRYTELTYGYADENYDYLSAGGEDEEIENKVKWIAFKNHFFSSILIADQKFSQVEFTSESFPDNEKIAKHYSAKTNFDLSITPKKIEYYLGPNDYKILTDREDLNLHRVIPLGWGIFGWINRYIVMNIFDFFKQFDLGYGLIILLLTIFIKLILTPITYKNFLSSAKMRAIKPFVDEINKKHKNADAMLKQQKTMELYNKAGVNPLAGCLPMLLQIPILFAMFRFFPASIDLRQASFLWADDLSAYDSIYDFGFHIPIYGDHISLFTLLMAISTFFYTRMTSSSMPQTQQPGMPNMKIIMSLMPIMMIFWFNDYSSGLSYYYLMANVINIAQMLVIKNYVIDEEKLKAKIIARKESKNQKKSRLQRKMDQMMEQSKKPRK